MQQLTSKSEKTKRTYCSLANCSNHNHLVGYDHSLFSFPSNVDRFQHWMRRIPEHEKTPAIQRYEEENNARGASKALRVCKSHFSTECFADLTKKQLLKTAVPSYFTPAPNFPRFEESMTRCSIPDDNAQDSMALTVVESDSESDPGEGEDAEWEPRSDLSLSDCSEADSERSDESIEPEDENEVEKVEKSFLVSEGNLRQLLRFCPMCGSEILSLSFKTNGFGLSVMYTCSSGHSNTWRNMEYLNHKTPKANVLIPASLSLHGKSFEHIRPLRDQYGLQTIDRKSFFEVNKVTVYPAIKATYDEHMSVVREKVAQQEKRSIIVACDQACDSPGRNANVGISIGMIVGTVKFDNNGTPTGSEASPEYVISYSMKHRSETQFVSNRMEGASFIDIWNELLCDQNIKDRFYGCVTDGCVSIPKLLRSVQPEEADLSERKGQHYGCVYLPTRDSLRLGHMIDPWHLLKSLKKKLANEARKKENAELNCWIMSIINHCWKAIAMSDGDPERCREVMLSLLWHIQDVHVWWGQTMQGCFHDDLSQLERTTKPWLQADTPPHNCLKEMLMRSGFLKNLDKTVLSCETSLVESFNAKLRRFLPKRIAFRKLRSEAMLQVCVMEWNEESANRVQAMNQDGTLRYKYVYSKVTGRFAQKPVYRKRRGDHKDRVLSKVTEIAKGEAVSDPLIDDWPKLSAPIPFPGKDVLFRQNKRRLSR